MTTQKKNTNTYQEVLLRASSFLEENEHSSFVAEWLMRERLNWTKTDLIKHYREEMPELEHQQFKRDLEDFIQGKPMQQVIGHEWFYGRKFKVTKDTLIPRPETEEWLDRVLKKLPNNSLNVLDIGTGTGVLAITHKLERSKDEVTATDISEEALKVAKENAEQLGANITFKQGNLFEPVSGESFDVILCNPPYISEDELDVMDQSVIDYEPKSALFAEEDGLAIYYEISHTISKYINSKAQIFLEIGYQQGEKVAAIFQKALPQATIEIWKDLNDLDRVVAIFCE